MQLLPWYYHATCPILNTVLFSTVTCTQCWRSRWLIRRQRRRACHGNWRQLYIAVQRAVMLPGATHTTPGRNAPHPTGTLCRCDHRLHTMSCSEAQTMRLLECLIWWNPNQFQIRFSETAKTSKTGLVDIIIMSITHTRTHPFQPVPKVKPIWILLKQETVSGSGIGWDICKFAPCSIQIIMPAPRHSVFTGRMPFLPPNQQCQSTEGTDTAITSVNKCI